MHGMMGHKMTGEIPPGKTGCGLGRMSYFRRASERELCCKLALGKGQAEGFRDWCKDS